jgi:DNA-binding beta-propeller fold protein YncE
VSGTVSVISLETGLTLATIGVGTEPYAVAASPNGTYVYVANASSNSLSVHRNRRQYGAHHGARRAQSAGDRRDQRWGQ